MKPSLTYSEAFWILCILLILLIMSLHKCSGMEFIDALAMVESNYNYSAVGDGGKALGAWQIRRAAWEDVRRIQPLVGQQRTHGTGYQNARTQRLVAETYLTILRQRLAGAGVAEPTPAQLHACWCIGFEGFRRIGFNATRAPATTRNAAKKLNWYLKQP